MVERTSYPAAGHKTFPYFFSEFPIGTPSGGIFLGGEPVGLEITIYVPYIPTYKDLLIYYDTLTGDDFIACGCTRWTVDNYSTVVETFLKEDDLELIKNHITPGAVKQLYSILGLPKFFDTTFAGDNTLRLVPNISSSSNLPFMRKEAIVYPKTIMTSPLESDKGLVVVKIEAYVSSTSEL